MNNRVRRLNDLLTKAENLPDEIISSEDFKLHFDDPETGDPAYAKKRVAIFKELSDLRLALRGYIKVNFGSESEYFDAIHEIYFTSEGLGFVINTFNINHNEYWLKGKKQLISLIHNILAETNAKIDFEKDQRQPFYSIILRIALFLSLGIISQFIIWNSHSLLLHLFAVDKLLQLKYL